LAVEIEITRSFVNRMRICEALGIPELWRFDDKRLRCYHLGRDGQYVENDRSLHFPFLKVQEMVAFLQKRTQMDEISLVRLFRDWVREQITKSGHSTTGGAKNRPKKPSPRKDSDGKRKKK